MPYCHQPEPPHSRAALVNRGMNATCLPCLLPLGGCDGFPFPIFTDQVRVILVNSGSFPVHAVLFYGDDQTATESALRSTGTRLEHTIPAGQSVSFLRDCDELQAIMIDEAHLQVLGTFGPETDTDVVRDGDDFGCRDTITFTFRHSWVLLDFGVTVTVN